MSYTEIVDGTIDAYSPVIGARIFKPFKDNDDALTIQIVNPVQSVGGAASGTSYATVGTCKLYIPPFMVGSGGTRLHAWCLVEVDAGASEATAGIRLQIAGTNSGELTATAAAFGSDSQSGYLDVDWTPTADTIVSVLIQGKRSASATSNNEEWVGAVGLSTMIRLPDPT